MKQKFTAVLIIVLFSFLKLNTANAQANTQDSLALVDLYNSTDGAHWTIRWNLLNPISKWFGITVTNYRVTYIYLESNKLSGTLPASLGKLSNLTGLDLSYNKLAGSIPASFGNLSNLEKLILDANELNGTIPSSFSKLTKLHILTLVDNQLAGGISFLSKLDSIEDVDLTGNLLSGKVPVINSSILGALNLNSNQFSGSIPIFKKDTTLFFLTLSKNKLTGDVNHKFDSLPNLSILYLNNNQLTGKIPSSFNTLVNLNQLDLSYNQLSGKIPSLGHLTQLYQLHLQNNQFTFAGLENIATTFPFATYSPQANINIQQNGNVLSVSAGGTLANNTYNWYKNGVLFKTKTGNAHLTINNNGNYSVDVTNAVATTLTLHSDTINYIMFTSLSNEQVNNQNKILKAQVYPNPANTNATISFYADGKYVITIADVSGKIFQTKTSVTTKGINTIQLDVSKYASGIYLITITDEKNRRQTLRLSKE